MKIFDTQKFESILKSVLDQAQKKGADAEASIIVDSGISVNVRLGEVETVEFNQAKSLGLTVYKNQKKASVSTSDLTKEAVENCLSAALRIAEYTEKDPHAGLPEKDDLASTIPNLELSHPMDLTPDQAIQNALLAENAARAYDSRIRNSEGANFITHQKHFFHGNTLGFLSHYPSTRYALSCTVIAQDGQFMQRDQEFTVSRQYNALDPFAKVGEVSATKAVKRLNAQKIKTQEAPVIFFHEVAGGLFGSFISAISGSTLYRKSSFLLDHLDEKIFPDFLQIEESPHLLRGLGSAPFDQEGVQTTPHAIVRNGILKSYVLSSYSARKLGLKTTGNAGGIHNLIVSHGLMDLDGLIKKMHKGLLVTELMGHGINLVTGDYSRGAFGFWVENGEIQYPVEEITIAGNLKNMFLNLIDISNDLERRGNIQTGSVLIDRMTIAGN